MTSARYTIRPLADRDLEEQAYYYATVATAELGHRFLLAAHDTFALLAEQKDFEKILVLYRPLESGVEILRVLHGSRNLDELVRGLGLQ